MFACYAEIGRFDTVVGDSAGFARDVGVGLWRSVGSRTPLLRYSLSIAGGGCICSPGGVEDRLVEVCTGSKGPFGGAVLVTVVGSRCTAEVGVSRGWRCDI